MPLGFTKSEEQNCQLYISTRGESRKSYRDGVRHVELTSANGGGDKPLHAHEN